MKRTVLTLVAIAGTALTIALPADGQTTGRLRGAVVDTDGLALPGVTVTIRSEALMGGSRLAVTGGTGAYSFTALPPGRYDASAALDGFRPVSHEALRVSINTTATANFVLEPAEFAEEMTVTGEAPLVDVASSALATNFTAEFFEDLPTNRWQTDVMAVSPGVSIGMEGNPFHASAFGADLHSSSWSVDGIDFSSPDFGSNWIMFSPDVIGEIQVMGVGAPVEFGNFQGAAFNVVTKSGSNQLKGAINAFWFDDSLVDSDIGFGESEFPEYEQVDPFLDLAATLGGAFKKDRLWYFIAYSRIASGHAWPGQDPATSSDLEENRFDVKLSTRINDRNLLEVKGGIREPRESWGQNEFTAPSAAPEWLEDSSYWALNYQSLFNDRTFLEARLAGWRADVDFVSQTGSTEPAYIDYSPPGGGPTRYSGGLWWPWFYETSSDQASVTVSHFADDFIAGDHDFKFGVQVNRGDGSNRVSPSAAGTYYTHYSGGPYDYFYRVEGSPYYYGSEQEAWGLFVDDSWAVSPRLTVNLGLRFDHAEGIVPSYPILTTDGGRTGSTPSLDPAFTWDNWSPRIGFAYNAGATRRTVIRGSLGIYYNGVIGTDFDGPPLYTPTMSVFSGPSWDGPWDFEEVLVLEELTTAVAPDLQAPRTREYSLGFEREFKDVYSFGAQVVYRDSEDGIGWQILDDGVYETFDWTDPFTGREYTLLNPVVFPTIRKGNGPGFTVEGHLNDYWAEYTGLILTFDRRFADWWSVHASYTYSDSTGLSPRALYPQQGGPLGLKIGSHPNQWLNLDDGQQRMTDRPHMFRVLANWLLPWDLHASTVINLQSGRPYTRQARVFYNNISYLQTNFVVGTAGGSQRHDFQNLIDFAIGKRWQLPGDFTLKTDLQFFNLLNSTAADSWVDNVLNEGDEFVPSSWVRPRRLMLRIGLEY